MSNLMNPEINSPSPLSEKFRMANVSERREQRGGNNRRLLACLEDSVSARSVAAHASAIAPGLGLAPTLARVFDTASASGPADPIEWQMHRINQKAKLERLAEENGMADHCDVMIDNGPASETLIRLGRKINASIIVAAKHERWIASGLGSTASGILDRANSSVFLVPSDPAPEKVSYRRILVPIDGSPRADSALPVALLIARSHGAEVLLAHVVPSLCVIDEGHAPRIRNLRGELEIHNRRELEKHLRHLCEQLCHAGASARFEIAGPGDPRLVLRQLIDTEGCDLLVMSSHGMTGIESISCGSVTRFLAGLPNVPVLVLRPDFHCEKCDDNSQSSLSQPAFSF